MTQAEPVAQHGEEEAMESEAEGATEVVVQEELVAQDKEGSNRETSEDAGVVEEKRGEFRR